MTDTSTTEPADGVTEAPAPRSRPWWRGPRGIVAVVAIAVAGSAIGLLVSGNGDGARSTSAYCAAVRDYAGTLKGLDANAANARDTLLPALQRLDAHAPGKVRDDVHLIMDAYEKLAGGELAPVADPAQSAALDAAAKRVDAFTSDTCGVTLGG